MIERLRTMPDEDLHRIVIGAVREAGFRGGADVLGVTPLELRRLVCARGIDLVAGLLAEPSSETARL
jgi:hypothetical protein